MNTRHAHCVSFLCLEQFLEHSCPTFTVNWFTGRILNLLLQCKFQIHMGGSRSICFFSWDFHYSWILHDMRSITWHIDGMCLIDMPCENTIPLLHSVLFWVTLVMLDLYISMYLRSPKHLISFSIAHYLISNKKYTSTIFEVHCEPRTQMILLDNLCFYFVFITA